MAINRFRIANRFPVLQWKKEKLEVYYCGEGYNAYTDYRYKGCGTC
jgi:hypothetical protein